MLPIGIYLDSDVVTVIPRVLVAGLYGATDTKIEWQLKHDCAGFASDASRCVTRAIVDHSDIDIRALTLDSADYIANSVGLIESRNDRKTAHPPRPALDRD